MTRAKLHRACVLVVLAGVLLSPTSLLADTLNSNPFVAYYPAYPPNVGDVPVEFYIQTDKAVYELGEPAELLFRVTNIGEAATGLPVALPREVMDIWIRFEDESVPIDGHVGHVYSAGGYGPWWGGLYLLPGDYEELSWTWKAGYRQTGPPGDQWYGPVVGEGAYQVWGVFGGFLLFGEVDGKMSIIWERFDQKVTVDVGVIPEPCTLAFLAPPWFVLIGRKTRTRLSASA